MKKKYTLIPVVAIILAVLTGLFISLFTTPVLYYITENKSPYTEIFDEKGYTLYYDYDDWFYSTKKVGKITMFVYKINPSYENLDAVRSLYDAEWYIRGTHKGNTPPKDYLKNSIKYSKIAYERDYSEGESPYAVPRSSFTDNPIFIFHKLPLGLSYAKSLFLDGQTEESQKVFEELWDTIDKNNEHDIKYFTMSVKDYLYLLYSSTENVSVKQWVLEKEAQLEKALENEESTSEYIKNHGFLFSNPDYDTYVSGNWADRDPIKDVFNQDETEEEVTEKTAQTPTP